MSVELYQPCEMCRGTGLPTDLESNVSASCLSCRGQKFWAIGLTMEQVQRVLFEATHFYWADGTCEDLFSWNIVKERRIEAARELERLRKQNAEMHSELEGYRDYDDLRDCRQALRDIAKIVGCNHTESPDGRRKLVQCVEDAVFGDKENDD